MSQFSEIDDLDGSWIKEHEKMSNINQNYFREPMEYISLNFIYMNMADEIVKVESEDEDLSILSGSGRVGITKERLLHIIQSRRKMGHIKYKLLDILYYVVDLESDKIQSFSKMEDMAACGSLFLKNFPLISGDMEIFESIFIFHHINSIYFLFKEVPLKSILKKDAALVSQQSRAKSTKKVRISLSGDDELSESKNLVDMTVPLMKKRFTRYLRKSIEKKGLTRKQPITIC
jgi:hypothetical protein